MFPRSASLSGCEYRAEAETIKKEFYKGHYTHLIFPTLSDKIFTVAQGESYLLETPICNDALKLLKARYF